MSFPFAFRSLAMQTRKAPESEAILTGQPLEAERKYGLVGEQVVVGSRGGGNEDGTKMERMEISVLPRPSV